MRQTIEIDIDAEGRMHPLEPMARMPVGRAWLTLITSDTDTPPQNWSHRETRQEEQDDSSGLGRGADLLALLQTPRFAKRPPADPGDTERRIQELRSDWGPD